MKRGNIKVADYPHIAAEWHFERNGDLRPEDVSFGSDRKVWWLCLAYGHEWEAIVGNRCRLNRGCPYCSGLLVSNMNRLATLRPDISALWHPTLNDDLTPWDVSIKSARRVWWLCERGHSYSMLVYGRTDPRSPGCPICSNHRVSIENSLSTRAPKIASEWAFELNACLPSEVAWKSNKKAWWVCEKGHFWEAVIGNRTSRNDGCPKCLASKGEKSVADALQSLGVDYRRQFKFKHCRTSRSLPFDFVILPIGKAPGLIEYQGEHHFKDTGAGRDLKGTIRRDLIKRLFAIDHNIELLAIPYWEFPNIHPIVERYANSLPHRESFNGLM